MAFVSARIHQPTPLVASFIGQFSPQSGNSEVVSNQPSLNFALSIKVETYSTTLSGLPIESPKRFMPSDIETFG
jgi:hypothetical protein